MCITSDLPKLRRPSSSENYDTVVMGAGPYGLATATHLRGHGLHTAVFGKPLSLWREQMPKGMLLRSYWWATSISDPQKHFSMERYFQEMGQTPIDPLPGQTFIDYGLWFRKRAVPSVDETFVETIEYQEDRFIVTLADKRVVQSLVLVMAPGFYYYLYRPTEYNHLPAELVSHTSNHNSFERFAGKQLVIIGGGQSALETAALAHENGADVQLVARSPLAWIKAFESFPECRPLIEKLRAPKAGISPGWFNWKLEHFPYHFQRLSRGTKDRLLNGIGSYGPRGAAWLRPRVEGKVLIHELQQVQGVKEVDNGIQLTLSNGKKLRADHVILGTGYRVDIHKLPMLHPQLASGVQTYRNAPILNNRFESSVPGLYFVGFSSVSSCGPLYRFVVGTDAAARRVAHSIARQTLFSGRRR